jgi:succinate dehydrogenase / fumarate reductase, cytochrome b subunit
MSWFSRYIRSSIGAKHIMALTGIGLVLFAIAHMVGHFAVFVGQDAYNTYAATLQSLGALKWLIRGGLVAIVVIHIAAALRLVALNKAARPVKYAVFRPRVTPFYARAMPWTGLIVLAFIIYHLLHFTFGVVLHDYYTLTDAQGRHDVYSMLVLGFKNPVVSISYIIATFLLSLHLAHGVSSMFQSLGIRHPKYDRLIGALGPAVAAVLFVGFISTPVAVLAGLVQLPGA